MPRAAKRMRRDGKKGARVGHNRQMKTKQHIEAGDRFGRLLVVEIAKKVKGHTYYLCACDCGTRTEVRKDALMHGRTTSCGCYLRETTGNRARKHGMGGGKEGHKGRAPEYSAWAAMLRRCYTTTDKRYPYYGGRGITVCDRWRESFENFYEDMGPRPSPKHSLDRENNEGNYEPANCRWTTPDVQARNTRHNVKLTFNGKTQTISEWTRELGFPREIIRSRLARGWPVDVALTTPPDQSASRRVTNRLRKDGVIK